MASEIQVHDGDNRVPFSQRHARGIAVAELLLTMIAGDKLDRMGSREHRQRSHLVRGLRDSLDRQMFGQIQTYIKEIRTAIDLFYSAESELVRVSREAQSIWFTAVE